MADDVLLNKCTVIVRCLQRIGEDYVGHHLNDFWDLVRWAIGLDRTDTSKFTKLRVSAS